jgi:hypothetical protein
MITYFSNKIISFYGIISCYFMNNYISPRIYIYYFLTVSIFIHSSQVNYLFIFTYNRIKIIKIWFLPSKRIFFGVTWTISTSPSCQGGTCKLTLHDMVLITFFFLSLFSEWISWFLFSLQFLLFLCINFSSSSSNLFENRKPIKFSAWSN